MHKCLNCGKEYEGNFCPFCGARGGEEKLCPKCGSHCSPNAKFCNNCGYAFDGAEKSVSKNTGSISESTIKVHLFAEYLRYALFLIFSVLLFGLFAMPVAIMPGGEVLGEKIPSQSYGNLYDLCGGEYNELFPNLQIYGKLGILFAALSAVFAVCVTIFSCARPFKFKRLNLFGIRGVIRLTDVAEVIACIFYITFIIITSVTTAKISGLDGGIGLIKAGACPVSVLVLSCIFLVLHLIARLTEYYLDKHVPEISISARGEKYYRGEYALATIQPPVPPEPVGKQYSISALVKLKRLALIFILCFIYFAIEQLIYSCVYYWGIILGVDNIIFLFNNIISPILSVTIILLIIFTFITLISLFLPVKKFKAKKVFKIKFCVFLLFISVPLFLSILWVTDGYDSYYYALLLVLAYSFICGFIIYTIIFNHKLKKRYSSLDDIQLSEQNKQYKIYRKYLSEYSLYRLQYYSYLRGKDYNTFRPSKIAVWLYRERKILCGVALTVAILFAIITILL